MAKASKARLAGLLLCLTVSGCVTLPQSQALKRNPPTDLPRQVELAETPFFPQEQFQCGPATLAMALNSAGVGISPEALTDELYIPARQGSLQVEMLATARRLGTVAYPLAGSLSDVLREIAGGTPVIVLQNLGLASRPVWHYAIVIGYDLPKSELILRSGLERRKTISFDRLEYTWRDGGHWAMIAIPPSRAPATATETQYGAAIAALERIGKTAAAHRAYAALLERWPQSLVGWIGRGNTAYALKRLDESEAAFRRATETHPNSAAAFNNLAQVLSERGKLTEARRAAERAVSLGGELAATSRATLDEITRQQGLEEIGQH
jgi:tetratricopeptide (TPR) repeat protein